MLMNSCVLCQLVKRTFTVLSSNQVSVRNRALKKEPAKLSNILVLRKKVLEFFKISHRIVSTSYVISSIRSGTIFDN